MLSLQGQPSCWKDLQAATANSKATTCWRATEAVAGADGWHLAVFGDSVTEWAGKATNGTAQRKIYTMEQRFDSCGTLSCFSSLVQQSSTMCEAFVQRYDVKCNRFAAWGMARVVSRIWWSLWHHWLRFWNVVWVHRWFEMTTARLDAKLKDSLRQKVLSKGCMETAYHWTGTWNPKVLDGRCYLASWVWRLSI